MKMPPFDPSQLDPKVLMELSQLVQQLPPSELSRMQSLMHNMMAGFDVSAEMAEFERNLPAGFREKLMGLMTQSGMGGMAMPGAAPMGIRPDAHADIEAETEVETDASAGDHAIPGSVSEARLTILRAVADGRMSPEDAEKLLFSA